MEPFRVSPVTLSLHHVRLEPLFQTHFESLMEQAADPDIWRFMGSGNLIDPAEMRRFYEFAQEETAQGKGVMFSIIALPEEKAIGMTGLYDIQPQHRHLELGRTWLGKDYRRTAINTEAKYLLLGHCFEVLKANRVTIKTDSRNERSQRAIERIGGVREGILRHHMVLWDGYIRDTVYYSVIAPEWPQTKQRIEALLAAYPPSS